MPTLAGSHLEYYEAPVAQVPANHAYAGYQDPNDGLADTEESWQNAAVEQQFQDYEAEHGQHNTLPLPVSASYQEQESAPEVKPTRSARLPKIKESSEPGKQSPMMIGAIVAGLLATGTLATITIRSHYKPVEPAYKPSLSQVPEDSAEVSTDDKATDETASTTGDAGDATASDSANANLDSHAVSAAGEPAGAAAPGNEAPPEVAMNTAGLSEPVPLEMAPTEAATPEQDTPIVAPKAKIILDSAEPAPVPPTVAPEAPPVGTAVPAAISTTAVSPEETRAADPSLIAPPPDGSRQEQEADAYIHDPREVLDKFLAARNWKDRLPYSLNADVLQGEMEEYYREHADGAVAVQSVTFLDSARTTKGNRRITIFDVACQGGPPFPVSVEETLEGNKVDWHMFVEFKDLRLVEFFKKHHEQPGIFRVILRRTHFFPEGGQDAPNLDTHDCFCVNPPQPLAVPLNVWVDKDNKSLIERLGRRYEFGEQSQPIVSLRWVRDGEGKNFVMLDEVLADNWRQEELRKRPEVREAKITTSVRQPK